MNNELSKTFNGMDVVFITTVGTFFYFSINLFTKVYKEYAYFLLYCFMQYSSGQINSMISSRYKSLIPFVIATYRASYTYIIYYLNQMMQCFPKFPLSMLLNVCSLGFIHIVVYSGSLSVLASTLNERHKIVLNQEYMFCLYIFVLHCFILLLYATNKGALIPLTHKVTNLKIICLFNKFYNVKYDFVLVSICYQHHQSFYKFSIPQYYSLLHLNYHLNS